MQFVNVLVCFHGYKHHQCVRCWQISLTPSPQGSMGGTGVGDQRDGQQGRDRHGSDGQSRGCNAPGAGDLGLRPRVVGPRPAGHTEAWWEHEASPGQTRSAEQPPREQGPHGTKRSPVTTLCLSSYCSWGITPTGQISGNQNIDILQDIVDVP